MCMPASFKEGGSSSRYPQGADEALQQAVRRTSPVVQWLRLHAPNSGGPGLIPDQGTRSYITQLSVCMPLLKRLHMPPLRPGSPK